MRRRVTTADYYRYYRIPTHLLVSSRSVPSHAILLVLHSVRCESKRHFARDRIAADRSRGHTDFHARETLERARGSRNHVRRVGEISAARIYECARRVEPEAALLQLRAHFYRSARTIRRAAVRNFLTSRRYARRVEIIADSLV